MNRYGAAWLASRVIAVALWADAAIGLVHLATMFATQTALSSNPTMLIKNFALPYGLMATFGGLFWWGAGGFAIRVVRMTGDAADDTGIDTAFVLIVECAIVGAFFTSHGLVSLVQLLEPVLRAERALGSLGTVSKIGPLVAVAVRLNLGLWLLFGSRSMVKLLFRICGGDEHSRSE